jgi:molecular chaperone DnaK (HSP70)
MLAASLTIAGPDGQRRVLLKKGATLPAAARAVFATQQAGERALSFKLFEGESEEALRLIGTWRAELPPGLPANTWLAVHVEVGEAHAIRVEVKENLRRLRIRPTCDRDGAESALFSAAT